MKSLYDFIIQPLGDKYSNTVKIGNKNIVVNTKIENWKFVNRLAVVKQTPLAFNTKVKVGDIVVIHQNVFRTFYNMKGEKKKVDLTLKMICIFVLLIRYIYIKIKKVGIVLAIDVL